MNIISANINVSYPRWVRTGDEVLFKKSGDIYIVDRLKVCPYFSLRLIVSLILTRWQEIFKVRGFQVAPAELEGHLLEHPDVGDAGIIGIPDQFSGELPMAFIALNADASRRVKADPGEAERIKAALIKVKTLLGPSRTS